MYVAHNRLPIQNEEQRKVLEERFAKAGEHMKRVPGFAGFQMLRASDNSHYIVSTTWESEQHFQDWIQSPHFASAHGGQSRAGGQAQVATYEIVYNS
ncbi:antibiotic biosynthesis monooxygenase family protein [Alicyclobacillus fastidiosus]|uniref:Antibiotic biosynthesis monooxygenase n=1 Tax=Alicyclobacillus fastidiosus TaxID=392011 RepID=A0ABV5AL89_9BACL|nr:antibiotic biosynthesis monooxygenase [Alicyclobacillus fastidiosus]WEH09065.1 antibiotic biosynthesis monooxygenase [Alicyclobacillus fastidiosus]